MTNFWRDLTHTYSFTIVLKLLMKPNKHKNMTKCGIQIKTISKSRNRNETKNWFLLLMRACIHFTILMSSYNVNVCFDLLIAVYPPFIVSERCHLTSRKSSQYAIKLIILLITLFSFFCMSLPFTHNIISVFFSTLQWVVAFVLWCHASLLLLISLSNWMAMS